LTIALSEMSVERVRVSAYTIPTDAPEADGTFSWNSTTLVLCAIQAADKIGIGYTFGDKATALLADELATKCLLGQPAFDIPALHGSMLERVRNDGSRGIASMAISALDVALWYRRCLAPL
jgi:L-alanine-DL-glutamate epimerase-like enolase superfamily enzyme